EYFMLYEIINFLISPSHQEGSLCPDRCDCQHPQHTMCTNRGLRTVPEPGGQVSEEVLIFSLGGNFIGNISDIDFRRYNNLVRLNLQYNQIQNIHPKAFQNLSNLEELYLGHNLLSDITTGTLQTLKKLTILYGNNNDIKRISPGLFTHLGNLVKLRLDGNSLQDLQDSVFKSLTSLHYLHLESNKVHHIHRKAFSGLTSLRFLNLAHNKQSAVRNALTFSHLAALTTLLLSENEIRYIGANVFRNLKKLSRLSLSNNRISRLDRGALKGLSSLRELLIDGNELEEIPAGLLDSLERIEELDFSRNQISNVDSLAFSQLKHLKVLKLENNMLTSLSGDIFALNNVLYDLDLHGNNWTCDCRLEDLKRWMTAAHSQGKLLTAFLQCQHPEGLRGKYLDYVNSSELQPLEKLPYLCESQSRLEESRGGGVLRREREKWKSKGGKGEVGVQGDQGGVAVAAASTALEKKKPKKVPLRPVEEAVFTRAKGRRRPNVLPRTDPPPIFPTSHAGERHENATETLSATVLVQTGEKYDLLMLNHEESLPVITDPCMFNHYFLTNVSVDHVTSNTVTVYWTTKEHRRYTPAPGPGLDEVHYRIMYDRFGTPERFPRYVYTQGTARSVTLRELSSEVTYMICVEGVVGRSVCQVAPRDHCAGLVTLPAGLSPGWTLTSDLQLLTLATLAANIMLLVVIGGIWLGRRLKRRLQRRKSAVHVRHMYSTRRPFRSALATATASTDFASYQSSRAARLVPHADGDLIEFPCDRFFDSNSVRRDSEMQRFVD
uniref:Fibronectin type-III domain-containing protein n=1 Tax=Takifugu rubripes TaxID=31033 RepID=H2VBF4_TAKRU